MEWMVMAGAGVTLCAFAGYGFSVHNRLVALDERCSTAAADVDVLLKHRHSLIPNLVETVRGFAGHEIETLRLVTESRSRALGAHEPAARMEAETALSQQLTTFMAQAERYPDIKASSHFRELRRELTDTENRITAARRYFNLAVDEYNATLRQFPGNVIGARANLARRQAFDLGLERVLLDEPVSVRF